MSSQSECLRYYQNLGYNDINQSLRKKYIHDIEQDDPSLYHCIKEIDAVMSYKNTGITVYRGVNHLTTEFRDDFFIERGFSSTSTSLEVTRDFLSGGCCVLSMTIPHHIKSYRYKKDNFFKEDEILLQRNILYVVGKPYMESGMTIYPCTISPSNLIHISNQLSDELYSIKLKNILDYSSKLGKHKKKSLHKHGKKRSSKNKNCRFVKK